LKQNASAVVARAAAGEPLIVTDRGRPVARLLPLERQSHIKEMVESGQITMPGSSLDEVIEKEAAHWPDPASAVGRPSIMDVLDDLRADRV